MTAAATLDTAVAAVTWALSDTFHQDAELDRELRRWFPEPLRSAPSAPKSPAAPRVKKGLENLLGNRLR